MPVIDDPFSSDTFAGHTGSGSFWDGWNSLIKGSTTGTNMPMLNSAPIDYSTGMWGPGGKKAGQGYAFGKDGQEYNVMGGLGAQQLAAGNYWSPEGWSGSGSGSGGSGIGPDLKTRWYDQLKSDGQAADGSGLTRDYLGTAAGKLGSDVYGIGHDVYGLDHSGVDSWMDKMFGPAKTTTGGGSGGGSGGGGSTIPGTGYQMPTLDTSYKKNPYLDDMAQGLTDQAVNTWTRSIAPSLRSGAMATGGFGGSRQGVAEANALNDWSNNLSSSLAQLYGNDFQQSQNRSLQKYGMDQGFGLGLGNLGLGYYNAGNSYDLGLRTNDLGWAGLDANIAQRNFDNQLSGGNFGLSVLDRLLGSNKDAANTATAAQQKQMDDFMKWLSASTTAGGIGGTATGSTTQPGDVLSSIFGGGLLGQALAKYFG